MFWKKDQGASGREANAGGLGSPLSTESRGETVELSPESGGGDFSAEALDTLAEVLRSLGRHAFDLDEITRDDTGEAFEKWAMRLLVGEVSTQTDGIPPSKKRRGISRDWGGVRRFVEKHRKDEHDYVVTGMDNLRQAVRVFIQCTTGSFRAERLADERVSSEVDNLGRALSINDHAQIREAAERTAHTVRQELDARRLREQKQIDLLQNSMEKMRQELDHVKREAKIDALTRVFNRAAFDEHIQEVADQAFLGNTQACVVMLDIDHFKGINDGFGHQAGDQVLRQVADSIVRDFFRREDFIARYGGEEFAIVAQQTTFEMTQERVERLRQSVEKLSIQVFGKQIRVSVSFGVAELQRGEAASSWIKRADDALYRAKQKGRNRVSIAPSGHGEPPSRKGSPLGASLQTRTVAEVGSPEEERIDVKSVALDVQFLESEKAPASVLKGGVPQSSSSRLLQKGSEATRQSHTRQLGTTRKEKNSPIAALLGPSGRRS